MRIYDKYVKALMLDHYEIHFNSGETAFGADYWRIPISIANSSVTSLISALWGFYERIKRLLASMAIALRTGPVSRLG